MKQLVIFPRGQLTAKDKERTAKAGIVAVEADDPSKVVTLVPGIGLSGDELTMCAMEAMEGEGHVTVADIRAKFTARLHQRLKKKEEAK